MWRMLATISLASLLALSAHAQPSTNTSDPKARALMAALRVASGGKALDKHDAFHETGTIIRDGKAGTYEMYGGLHALRTAGIHTLEGKVGGGGFDGTTAWHFGPDGKVMKSTNVKEVANARSDAYFTLGAYNWPERFPATFRYLGSLSYQSKLYDVVEVTPEGATPADLWLDKKTHRIARVTVTDGHDSASIEIWDYRPVEGTRIGFRNYQVEGPSKMTQSLATFDYVPLDPKRLDPPLGGN
ncbi:MAG TPA: hypothetical protein VHW69_00800 [Rhizomicrobium sp.]|nr:hypothetical protein [Rhizomicrobium sp.]